MTRAQSSGDELPLRDLPTAEDDSLPRRAVWISGAVTAIVAIGAVLAADRILHSDQSGLASTHALPPPHAPDQIGIVEQTLILNTQRGLVERAVQRESLSHFGWSDRTHGIAKIPIDHAIDLVIDPAFMPHMFAAQLADAGREAGR